MPSLMFQAKVLVEGRAKGEVLKLAEPLSLWGGLNPETGEIIDRRHPQAGQIVTNRVLVLPSGRGSSSASSILLEAVKQQMAPAAIITLDTDGILALGAAVARAMYHKAPPVLVLDQDAYDQIQTGQQVEIEMNGRITISAS